MSETQKLLDVAEVREVDARTANEHLARGWLLLDQFTKMDIGPKDYCARYVIARPQSVDPDPPNELDEYIKREQKPLSDEEIAALELMLRNGEIL